MSEVNSTLSKQNLAIDKSTKKEITRVEDGTGQIGLNGDVGSNIIVNSDDTVTERTEEKGGELGCGVIDVNVVTIGNSPVTIKKAQSQMDRDEGDGEDKMDGIDRKDDDCDDALIRESMMDVDLPIGFMKEVDDEEEVVLGGSIVEDAANGENVRRGGGNKRKLLPPPTAPMVNIDPTSLFSSSTSVNEGQSWDDGAILRCFELSLSTHFVDGYDGNGNNINVDGINGNSEDGCDNDTTIGFEFDPVPGGRIVDDTTLEESSTTIRTATGRWIATIPSSGDGNTITTNLVETVGTNTNKVSVIPIPDRNNEEVAMITDLDDKMKGDNGNAALVLPDGWIPKDLPPPPFIPLDAMLQHSDCVLSPTWKKVEKVEIY